MLLNAHCTQRMNGLVERRQCARFARRLLTVALVVGAGLAANHSFAQAPGNPQLYAQASTQAAEARQKPLTRQQGELFTYVVRDNAGALRRLLEQGTDPNVRDANGQSPMTLALQEGSLNAFDALMSSAKTNVEFRNSNDESPLMLAALRGHLDAATRLLRQGAHPNKTLWSPLHYAASGAGEKQEAIARLLLANEAYIDPRSPNDTTPLMMAAQYGTDAVVKLLLAEGADATMQNQLGLTAADFAERAGRASLASQITASAEQLRKQREQPRTSNPQ